MRRSCIVSLIAFIILVLSHGPAWACTNYLVTKGASTDGSVMISYSADSHVLYGELYHWPAAKYPEGTMLDIREWDTGKYLGKIKQASETYNVVGNMNEFQLAIGETTFGGRKELVDTTGIMDYGSLIYVTLQRAKTAREAIRIMGELVAEYGYYSSGESFSIADPNEVWIMEMIGKGPGKSDAKGRLVKGSYSKGAVWVALRIPDGYISGHANHARITTFPLNDPENCVYSPDVITFAKKAGIFNGNDEEFSFSDVYAPIDFGGARFCEIRVWSMFKEVNKDMDQYFDYVQGHDLTNRMPLWIKPDRKISIQDMMHFMRDHLEGTPLDMREDLGAGPFGLPYRWRPLTWQVDGVTYCHERATATQQTGFSFISQSRSWLPNPIGGILWFGVDDASTSVYVPMYCGIKSVAEPFLKGNGDLLTYSPTSAFWVFNLVANFSYIRYDLMSADVKKIQKELEDKFIANTPAIDLAAKNLHESNPEMAISFLTDYSSSMTNYTFERWKSLSQYLLVKYIDGNVKKEEDGKFTRNPYGVTADPLQPGYPEWWLRKVVNDAGDKLRVIEPPK